MTSRSQRLSPTLVSQPAGGLWSRRASVFWSSWGARISASVILILLVIAIVPRGLWPTSAYEINLNLRHEYPVIAGGSTGHLLGTDALGRDIFYRIIMATKLTFMIAGVATLAATVTGTIAGLAAGYWRNTTDTIVSRFVEILLAFPILLLVLALVAAMGRSIFSVVIVLALTGWAGYTRIIRSATLSLAEREFVEAARCIGARDLQIVIRHVLPNVASPILVLSTFTFAQFILVESAISFLGLGPEPPDVTWGGLIGDGRNYMYEAWWVALFPGVAIFLVVMAFNLVGDAVRDAFDPHSRVERRR